MERIDTLHVFRKSRKPGACRIFVFRLNGDDWTMIRCRNPGEFDDAGQTF